MLPTATRRAVQTGSYFSADLFKFLNELRRNNTREWFVKNRSRYESVLRGASLSFIADFATPLRTISPHLLADPRPVGGSLFRIYRDTRFSNDKSPYKTQVGIHFRHRGSGEKAHAPGFYLHLEPGSSFAAAGLWHPDAPMLTKVRDAIVERSQAWKSLRSELSLEGDALKRPPKGYDPNHPSIEDLKRKDFVTSIALTQAQVCSPRFMDEFAAACRTMSSLVAFIAEALGLAWS